MKATMSMAVDTVWGNRITLEVETELDNPHILTTQELSALMIHSIKMMVEEVRVENERAVKEAEPSLREVLADQKLSPAERERERYHEVEHEGTS